MRVLFRKINVLTDDGTGHPEVMDSAFVAVENDEIKACTTDEKAARQSLSEPFEIYDGSNRILLPTFANTHNHMAMTLMRNSADDLPLHRWLFDVIFPREKKLDEATVAAGSRLALAEMIRSGTGASADMYYFHQQTAQAALDAGFRLNLCVDIQGSGSGQPTLEPDRIIKAKKELGMHSSGLLRVSLLVHSVYLYPQWMYPELAQIAEDASCPVQMHIGETEKEIRDCLDTYGRRPAEQLADFGFFKTPTLAAHAVYLNDAERRIMSGHSIFVAHCPASNLKLGSGLADIVAMEKENIPVVIGTDGAASNNNLDLYRELRLASYLAKGSHKDASVIPAEELLVMGTARGMKALGFDQCGRIAQGFKADMQIVRTDRIGLTPLGHPIAALMYSAAGSDVESVMVDGKWLMYRGELKTLDEERVRYEAVKASRALLSSV